MGRKVHPIGFRLGINQPWGGRWFAEGNTYRQQLHQDFAIRTLLLGKLSKGGWAASEKVRELRKQMPDAVKDGKAGISRIDVERTPGKVRISIHTAKPGILIGRKGEGVKKIRQSLEALVGKKIELDIKEISSPDTDAMLVAKNIADQLERRIAYRRAMKRAIQQAIKQGAEGLRSCVADAWVVLKCPETYGCVKAACLCRPCVPILISLQLKLLPRMARSVLKSGFTKVKFNLTLKKKSKRQKACTSASNRDVA